MLLVAGVAIISLGLFYLITENVDGRDEYKEWDYRDER